MEKLMMMMTVRNVRKAPRWWRKNSSMVVEEKKESGQKTSPQVWTCGRERQLEFAFKSGEG
jgi:hypothetical protein